MHAIPAVPPPTEQQEAGGYTVAASDAEVSQEGPMWQGKEGGRGQSFYEENRLFFLFGLVCLL